jgi:hypothetical protein
MKKDDLAKFYEYLTPEERFRLFIEAMAREDAGECRNLDNSCPREVYEMNDLAYQDRVKASEEIALLACLDLAPPSYQTEDAYGLLRWFGRAPQYLSGRGALSLLSR